MPVNPLRLPRLYAILDTAAYEARGFDALSAAETMLESGIAMLQYRHKAQFTEERFQEAARIADACRANRAIFILNDRVDYAHLLNCGVHIGQNDLPAVETRGIIGDGAIVGLSTHNQPQLEEAAGLPVDYVAAGPIFETGSKANPDPVVGLSAIPQFRSFCHKPLVAIGGITLESALSVLDSGADAVAVISGLLPEERGDLLALKSLVRCWIDTVNVKSPAL